MTQPYGQEPVGGEPEYRQPYGQQPPYGEQPAQYSQPYQQPAYPGYQSYQEADRRSAVANAYGSPIGSGAKFGVVGATFAGVGLVLLIISFTALAWFSSSVLPNSHVSDLHSLVNAHPSSAAGVASAYFSWLGWVLVVAGGAIAIAATLPSPVSGPLRALGAVLAAAAIALTFFAIQLEDGVAYSEFIKHASIGFYFAVGGFLLVGIGALCGPARR
jgi:hypothetical protein